MARWLVKHLSYGEGQAAALVDEHGARKVLDVIYDHVVKWKPWSNASDFPGSYRLRPTDGWGRPIRNHAAYLGWHIKQG